MYICTYTQKSTYVHTYPTIPATPGPVHHSLTKKAAPSTAMMGMGSAFFALESVVVHAAIGVLTSLHLRLIL